jgi:hypothetical protein
METTVTSIHHLQVRTIAGILMLAVIVSIGLFYLLTIRQGHAWGDDFSMYIHHAKNLSEGVPYGQTGYIYNPYLHQYYANQAQIGPQTYPPVVPLLLTPIYYFWGLNLSAFKIGLILTFILALIVNVKAFKNYLSPIWLAALIGIIGFNPYFWQFKDNIVSDIPFLFFIYLSLFTIQHAYESAEARGKLGALLVALSIYLAYGTRSIGILLIPCLLIYDFINNRKVTAFALQVVGFAGGLILLQNLLLHNDSSYADHLGFGIGVVLHHLKEYPKALSEFWMNGYSKPFRFVLFSFVSIFAILGYFICLRRRIGCFEIFFAIYLAAILVLPVYDGIRFLMPVIPLYLLYALVGIKEIFRNRERVRRPVFAALTAAIVLTYIGQYSKMEFGPIREGIVKSEAQQFFAYVREKTGVHDTFVFRKPRALTLFTGRSASAWHKPADDQALWDYFRKINATFLVLGPGGIEQEDQEYLSRFIGRNGDLLEKTFSNVDFEVYRIKGTGNVVSGDVRKP